MSQSLKEDHGHGWFQAQVFWFRQWQLRLIFVKTFEVGLISYNSTYGFISAPLRRMNFTDYFRFDILEVNGPMITQKSGCKCPRSG